MTREKRSYCFGPRSETIAPTVWTVFSFARPGTSFWMRNNSLNAAFSALGARCICALVVALVMSFFASLAISLIFSPTLSEVSLPVKSASTSSRIFGISPPMSSDRALSPRCCPPPGPNPLASMTGLAAISASSASRRAFSSADSVRPTPGLTAGSLKTAPGCPVAACAASVGII